MGGPSRQMQLNIQDDHSLSYSSPSLSTTPNRVGNPSSSSRSFDVWGFPKAPSTQTGRQIASRIVYRDARGLVDGTDLVASRTAESVASSASDDEGPKLLEGRQSGEESNDSEVDTARSRKKGKGKAETPPSRPSPQRRKRVIELPYDGDDDDNQSDPTPLPSTTQRPHSSPRKADLGAEGSRGRSRSTSLFDCVWVDNSRFSSPTKKSSVASSPTKTPRSVMASPSKKVPPLETLVLSSSGSGTEDPEEDDDDEEEEGHNPRRSQSKCDAYLFDSEAEEASESSSGSSEAVLKSRPTPTARSQLSSSRKRVVESESGTESKTEEEDVLPRSSTRSARRTQTKATASSRKRPASTSSSEISEESVGHRRIITSVPQPKKQKVLSTRSPPRRRFPSTTPSSKRKSVKEVAKKRERKRSDDEESENESDEAFIVNEDDDDDDEPVRSSSGKKSGRGSPKREKAKKGSIRTPTPSSGSESESEGDGNNGGSQQQDDDGTNSGDEDDLELSGEETMLPDDARRGSNKISKFAKLRMEREQKRYESMRRKRRVVDSDNDEPASTHHVARSYLGASEEEDAQDKDEDTDEGEDYSTQNGQTTDLDADIPGFIVDEDEDDQSETDRALVQDIRRRTLGKSQGPMYHFKVFLSWIVRSIIAPEIDWLADEEMLEAHNKVHEIYRDHLNSLLGSSAWTPVFRAAIKVRPTFILHEIDDALRATSCDACVMGRHRASIFRAELSGEAYDHKTLSPLNRKARKQLVHQLALENDNHSEKALKLLVDASQTLDFNLGKFCASRSQTYHELHHRPYSVRKELVDELKEVRREVEGIEEGEGEGGERGRKDEWERRIGREAERCVQVLEKKKVTTRLAKLMQDELATATRLFATSG